MKTGKYTMVNDGFFSSAFLPIAPDDLGFSRGMVVFEVVEARKNVLFHFEDHIERLKNSAVSACVCNNEYFEKKIKKILFSDKINHLLTTNGFYESVVKIYLTAGNSKDNFVPAGQPNLYVVIEDKSSFSDKKCFRLKKIEYRREFPHVKNTNYLASIIAMAESKRKNQEFDDILYLDWISSGKFLQCFRVLECSRMNIFILNKHKTLVTPREDKILPGVTRKIILKLAKDYPFSNRLPKGVKEEDILAYKDLSEAKEVFVTSSTQGIKPVVLIDDQKFKIGEYTLYLQKKFNEYREEYYKSRGA
jgi:branched-subunit amino acid aminotransferase/4-amino-4-deoxychorismate lyase